MDEFQDTNTIQYAWLRVLAGKTGHVMAVGDDDQSIYGWRGARIENIHRFSEDFAPVQVVRLEQNYRSTGNILSAANALIDRNTDRLGKELWTDGGEGDPIRVYSGYNDLDEARFIAERTQEWIDGGGSPEDVAVLYRSNAQSRVLEEAMLRAQIPYRIYGGVRFFERVEIKNALAYMRLMHDRHSDPAFERVVNTPTRGIGDKTVESVRGLARSRQISMWQACKEGHRGRPLHHAGCREGDGLSCPHRRHGRDHGRDVAARAGRFLHSDQRAHGFPQQRNGVSGAWRARRTLKSWSAPAGSSAAS